MSSCIIRVENIGKRYRVGPHQGRELLRNKIVDALRDLFALFRLVGMKP